LRCADEGAINSSELPDGLFEFSGTYRIAQLPVGLVDGYPARMLAGVPSGDVVQDQFSGRFRDLGIAAKLGHLIDHDALIWLLGRQAIEDVAIAAEIGWQDVLLENLPNAFAVMILALDQTTEVD
jgi:hypothetical protein